MTKTKRRLSIGLGVLLIALFTLGFGAGSAGAASVEPVFVPGNPDCADLNGDNATFPSITSDFGFKIEGDYNRTVPLDASAPGTFLTGGAPADSVNTVTVSSADGISFDWSSTLGMDAVIVKGGPNANVYVYTPEAFLDSGLHSPPNDQGGIPAISHIEFCYDYELTPGGGKTADAEYTRTYTWDIKKSVDPDSHTGWFGDTFSSDYEVFVNQTVEDSGHKVTGNIPVENFTPFTVEFSVADVIDVDPAGPGPEDVTPTVTCLTDTLSAGATTTCTYEALLSGPISGVNNATVSVISPAGVDGFTSSAVVAFGDPTETVGYPTINVTDYFDGDLVGDPLGEASGDFTFEFDRDFVCPTDEDEYPDGVHTDSFPNVAEIDETLQQDDANVDLTCYKPVVLKDADTEWFREYTWEITKSVDPASHTGFAGDSFISDYEVSVDQKIRDYGYRAFGDIYVTNPSGESITVDVADAVNGTTATVDCDPLTDGNQTSLTVAAGATESCSYTVDLGGTTPLVNTATVTFDGDNFLATADVIFGDPKIVGYPTINVTDYFDGDLVGDPLGEASGDFTFEFDRDFVCPTDEDEYTDGVHTDSFPNVAEIDETLQSDDANVDLTCYIPAEAKVIKTTTEGDEDIGQFPFTFKLYDPSGTLVETKTVGTGGGTIEFLTDLEVEGIWTVEEILPDGWVSTTATTCTFDVVFPAAAGQTFECTFDNVEKSRVDLLKLTNGLPTTSQTWSFEIYEGPDGFGGTLVASDSTPPALLDFGFTDLNPLATYTICELGVPPSFSTFWQIDTDGDGIGDVTVVPYNPDASDGEDLGNRCVNFGANTNIPLVPGTTLHFIVDNQSPGGAPRTPGYWKNWNMCSGGGQADTAAANGGWEEGFWLLEDVLAPQIGGGIIWDDILLPLDPEASDEFDEDGYFVIDDCEEAVDILDHRTTDDGKKVSSQPLHNLARNLLAAQLNFGAGACTTQDVLDWALEAETLLDKYNFDGTLTKIPKKSDDATRANELAEYLDDYNNGEFCGDGG